MIFLGLIVPRMPFRFVILAIIAINDRAKEDTHVDKTSYDSFEKCKIAMHKFNLDREDEVCFIVEIRIYERRDDMHYYQVIPILDSPIKKRRYMIDGDIEVFAHETRVTDLDPVSATTTSA